jgi:hypothetical protein
MVLVVKVRELTGMMNIGSLVERWVPMRPYEHHPGRETASFGGTSLVH